MTAMEAVTADLRGVRRLSRALLTGHRLAQAAVIAVAAAAILVALDFLLRLPGPIRLALGPLTLGLGLAWLGLRLLRIHRFWPSLDDLAHRAERLYPQLRGWLASAVEFHLHPERFDTPAATRQLTEHALRQHPQRLHGVRLKRLLDPTLFTRWIAAAAVALGMASGAVALDPASARIAAARWLTPLGDAAWPQRQQLVDHTQPRAAWPADGRVRIQAHLERGASPDLKLQIRYRFLEPGQAGADAEQAPFEEVLVSPSTSEDADQATGRYEALLEPPASLRNALSRGELSYANLEYQLAAGDDQLETATAKIAARPAVASLRIEFTPPAYAAGLIESQPAELDPTPGARAAASALQGSSAVVHVAWNKPLALPPGQTATAWLGDTTLPEGAAVEPVLATAPPSSSQSENNARATGLTLRFTLQEPARIELLPQDADGLRPVEPTAFELRPQPDQPPRAALDQPPGDESVLPTARIPVAGNASDDVAVESLRLDLRRLEAAAASSPTTAEAYEQAQPLDTIPLDQTGPARTLPLSADLELADLGAKPGQVLYLAAVSQDVYRDAQGNPRAPVRSDIRRLAVVSDQAFIDEVLLGLGAVRRDAQRLEVDQRAAQKLDPDPSAREQARIGRGVESIQSALRAVDQRVDRNRLDDPELQTLLQEAQDAARQAQASGDSAQQALNQARQASAQAEQSQREAEQALQEAQDAATNAGDDPQALADAAKQIAQASQRVQQATTQAQQAQAEVAPAIEQARQDQQQAGEALRRLAATLDAGGEIRAVRRQTQELQRRQAALAEQARALLPRTAGQSRDQLSPETQQELQDLEDQQQDLADDASELLDRLRTAAEVAARQGDSPDDQALAETMAEAADTGLREGLEPTMRDAAEAASRNALSQTASDQQQASQTLDRMLEELDLLDERKREALQRRLADLSQQLERLIAAQRARLDASRAAEPAAAPALAPAQATLRRQTIVVQATAESEPDTEEAAMWIGQAVIGQAQAVTTLRRSDPVAAANAQAAALQALELAKKLIDEQSDDAEDQERQQQRAELRRKYLELADTQAELRSKVEPLAQKPRLNRREANQAAQLAAEQADIRQAAQELGQQVQDTLVFKESHARIDRHARRAADLLSQRTADNTVLQQQDRVENLLRFMADALGPPKNQDPWEREGGGGGGGAASGPPPLVPPAAEVKLLQALQADLLERTKQAHQAADQPALAGQRQDRLRTLGADQRRLHELGNQMIQQLQDDMRPPAMPDAAPEEAQ